jgi:CDP-diacylglycerol pyrophosphatase
MAAIGTQPKRGPPPESDMTRRDADLARVSCRPIMHPGIRILLITLGMLGACTPSASDEPRSVLWPIVGQCLANQTTEGNPAPCVFADKARGYAILKDIRGPTQFLLIATDRRWGTEDDRIRAANAPNYFVQAWSARACVSRLADTAVPDSAISLAINSRHGRSDGQLHIHIDRVRADIAAQLRHDRPTIALLGHDYRVQHVDALAGTNIFALVQSAVSGDPTIVVIGDPAGGFYVLSDTAHGLDRASGEELQVDHPRLSPDALKAAAVAGCVEPS